MIALAIAPAIKPSTIHAIIPIRSPPVYGSQTSAEPISHATRVPRSGLRDARLLERADAASPAVATQRFQSCTTTKSLGKAATTRASMRRLVRVRAAVLGAGDRARWRALMVDGLLQLVGPLMTQRVIDVALPAHDRRARVALGAALRRLARRRASPASTARRCSRRCSASA